MSDTVNTIYSSSNNIAKFSKKYFDYLNNILNQIDNQKIQLFVKHLEKLRKNNSTIFVAGNGGSATTASTIANDLGFDIIKKTKTKKPFRFLSLTDNNGVLSAISNDVGYENVFINQLKIHYKKGDAILVISASGNSENLIRAVKYVNKNKGSTLALLGFDGGKLLKLCDSSILVKTKKGEFGPVEDAHLIINHIIAHWFQNKLNN